MLTLHSTTKSLAKLPQIASICSDTIHGANHTRFLNVTRRNLSSEVQHSNGLAISASLWPVTVSTGILNYSPFEPSSHDPKHGSASSSRRPVTLPYIPELYEPIDHVLDTLPPTLLPSANPIIAKEQDNKQHPFTDALAAHSNLTTTWNGAAAFKSTESPTLDAFVALNQSTYNRRVRDILTKSWEADPEITLKLIWNLRSIHDGKSDKKSFYRAFAWLYQNHPRTAIGNLHYLVEPCISRTVKTHSKANAKSEDKGNTSKDDVKTEVVVKMTHGYWKDLLNILLLAAKDELTPVSALEALHLRTTKTHADACGKGPVSRNAVRRLLRKMPPGSDKDAVRQTRLNKYIQLHNSITTKLTEDRVFRALYVTIARLFADALTKDLHTLREIADKNIPSDHRKALIYTLSLVGKWAPSIGGAHDRVTSIATAIAELLHKGGPLSSLAASVQHPLSQDVAHKLRSGYGRWVTSPLRRVLQIPEVAMSAKHWSKIQYTRVPSICMQVNKQNFFKHDEARFTEYFHDVTRGKKKISGATLLPHQILHEAISSQYQGRNPFDKKISDMMNKVINAQWDAMVNRVKESGTLDNALAICDVSGSMGYLDRNSDAQEPIFSAVALSILTSQIARPPWANKFITFSSKPQVVFLDPRRDLATTASEMVETDWNANTNFHAVFTKLLLPIALENKLRPEDMVKRLFVFSDMQFDESLPLFSRWATVHQLIKWKFNKAGYELPEIVYWNLAGDVAKPITKDEEGTAFMSGFSPSMMKIFLGKDVSEVEQESRKAEDADADNSSNKVKKRLTPIDTMMKVIGKESFAGLKVFD